MCYIHLAWAAMPDHTRFFFSFPGPLAQRLQAGIGRQLPRQPCAMTKGETAAGFYMRYYVLDEDITSEWWYFDMLIVLALALADSTKDGAWLYVRVSISS